MDTVVLTLRVMLAGVLLVAAVGKLLDPAGSRTAMFGFGVPARVAAIMGWALPISELALGGALLIQPSARWGAVGALALLGLFTAGIINVLARGMKTSCHCFGVFHSEPAGPRAVARNGALASLAAVVVAYGHGPSLTGWVSQRSAAELVAIGLGLSGAILAVLIWRLRRENSRLSASLSEAKAVVDAIPPGLPVNALAPDFDLPEVRGGIVTLESLRGRGLPVLLVFLGRGCVPTHEMLPDLARWQSTMSDRITIAFISRAGPEHHDYESRVLGMTDIGLQHEWETIQAYRVYGTPSAVLVSAEGRIASSLAQADWAIEALVRMTLRDQRKVGVETLASPITRKATPPAPVGCRTR